MTWHSVTREVAFMNNALNERTPSSAPTSLPTYPPQNHSKRSVECVKSFVRSPTRVVSNFHLSYRCNCCKFRGNRSNDCIRVCLMLIDEQKMHLKSNHNRFMDDIIRHTPKHLHIGPLQLTNDEPFIGSKHLSKIKHLKPHSTWRTGWIVTWRREVRRKRMMAETSFIRFKVNLSFEWYPKGRSSCKICDFNVNAVIAVAHSDFG